MAGENFENAYVDKLNIIKKVQKLSNEKKEGYVKCYAYPKQGYVNKSKINKGSSIRGQMQIKHLHNLKIRQRFI